MEFIQEQTLYQAFKKASELTPNNVALYYFNNKITFSKLSSLIDVWASILQNDFLIEKGDTILISLPNIPQTLILFYAANKIGAIVDMVHPYTPMETMQKYYDNDNAKVAFLFDKRVNKELKEYKRFKGSIVICDAQTFLKDRFTRSLADFSEHGENKDLHRNTTFSFFRKFKNNKIKPIENIIDYKETSVLLHSASTTGDSKTIMLSAKSFNYTASLTCGMLCMNEDEVINKTMISLLPSFHGFGLCMTMHAPLANSFGVALIPKFKPAEVVRFINKLKNVICICGTPVVYKNLLNYAGFVNNKHTKTLVSCFSGGDSLPPKVKESFDSLMVSKGNKCRLYEGYGLTEALSVCAVNTHRHHKYGSVGYPLDGVDFKIINDNGEVLSPNEIGEIAVKSSNNMIGYYKDETATIKAYDKDGYLLTGDIGYIDEDGFIYFASRKKRVIKVSGVAVFPLEIEDVISHIKGVKGVCAIQIPDENLTNAVKVFIISNDKNKDKIIEECKKHLISWAIPKEIEFVNKLPYTKFKKINFELLQKQENAKRGIM